MTPERLAGCEPALPRASGSASTAIRRRACCCCSMPATAEQAFVLPAAAGRQAVDLPIRHGAAALRRRQEPRLRRSPIRSPRAAPLCWSAEIVDAALIERLARLRGIGDAYHDYRGELRYFSARDQGRHPARHGLRAGRCRGARGRDRSIGGRARGAGSCRRSPRYTAARIGIDINIAARDFGASLEWTLRDRRTASGATAHLSTADCAEIWRGEVEGSWITRRRFELPLDLPPGYHELEVTIAGGAAERCLLIVSPPRVPSSRRRYATGRRLWGVAVQLYTVRSRENWGIGDFGDLRGADSLAGGARRRIRRLESAACARAGGPRAGEPLQRVEPAFPQCAVHRGARGAGVSANAPRRMRAIADASSSRADCSELRAAPLVDYRGVAELKFEILELLHRDFRERHLARGSAARRGFSRFRRSGRPAAANACPFRRARPPFSDDAQHGVRVVELARGVSRRDRAPRRSASRTSIRCRSNFICTLQWLAHEQLAGAQALGPRARHADRAVRRLCGRRESVRIRDLGRSAQLSHGRRNRRAAGSAGAQGPGMGDSAAGPAGHADASDCRGSSG